MSSEEILKANIKAIFFKNLSNIGDMQHFNIEAATDDICNFMQLQKAATVDITLKYAAEKAEAYICHSDCPHVSKGSILGLKEDILKRIN